MVREGGEGKSYGLAYTGVLRGPVFFWGGGM